MYTHVMDYSGKTHFVEKVPNVWDHFSWTKGKELNLSSHITAEYQLTLLCANGNLCKICSQKANKRSDEITKHMPDARCIRLNSRTEIECTMKKRPFNVSKNSGFRKSDINWEMKTVKRNKRKGAKSSTDRQMKSDSKKSRC